MTPNCRRFFKERICFNDFFSLVRGSPVVGQAQQKHRAVLIVEDDAELRHLTAALFEDEKVDTIECESAEAALAVMLTPGPELRLLFGLGDTCSKRAFAPTSWKPETSMRSLDLFRRGQDRSGCSRETAAATNTDRRVSLRSRPIMAKGALLPRCADHVGWALRAPNKADLTVLEFNSFGAHIGSGYGGAEDRKSVV